MFRTLELFGFGNFFINFVKLIYKDTNTSVILPQGTSSRFSIDKGIKQGCPIFLSSLLLQQKCFLFLLSEKKVHDGTNNEEHICTFLIIVP